MRIGAFTRASLLQLAQHTRHKWGSRSNEPCINLETVHAQWGSGEGYSRSAVRSCVDGLILNARIKYVEGTVSGCYCNARDSAKTLHQCQGLVLSPLKLLQYQYTIIESRHVNCNNLILIVLTTLLGGKICCGHSTINVTPLKFLCSHPVHCNLHRNIIVIQS